MASETCKERGWAEPTSRLRIHALISRRWDIHLHHVVGSPGGWRLYTTPHGLCKDGSTLHRRSARV